MRRAAEREGRRARRRRARELAPPPTRHIEGMSSDDEIPDQEKLAMEQQQQAIITEAQDVLTDVTEDFSNVGTVLARFEKWRATDPSAYSEAYAGSVLAKIATPWVRLALVLWNPLQQTSPSDDIEKQVCDKGFYKISLSRIEKI